MLGPKDVPDHCQGLYVVARSLARLLLEDVEEAACQVKCACDAQKASGLRLAVKFHPCALERGDQPPDTQPTTALLRPGNASSLVGILICNWVKGG